MKITVKSVLIFLGCLLGLAGFGMMFLSPLKTVATIAGTTVTTELDWQLVLFGILKNSEEVQPHATASMIGFIMMGAGGLLALILAIIANKKGGYASKLLLGIVIGLIIAAGGALAIMTKYFYIDAKGWEQDAILAKPYQLNLGAIIGGALGCAGGLLTIIGGLLPGPKKGKRR